jgi:hypothetical protein
MILRSSHVRLPLAFTCALVPVDVLRARVAPAPSPARPAANGSATTATGDTVVELSPFVISSDSETGRVATQTLGGSRMKTDFKDLAQPMEVLTMDFMRDLRVNSFDQGLIDSNDIEGFTEIVDGDARTSASSSGATPPACATRVPVCALG